MTTPRPLRHPEILYRPELQSLGQRTLYSVLTLVAWTVWLYLFVPLLSLLAWWFGIDLFSRYLLEPAEHSHLLTLLQYVGFVVLSAVVVVTWSLYNLRRYGGLDRRKPIPPVSDAELRERHHVDADTLAALRRERRVVLHLDPAIRVETPAGITPPECAAPGPDRSGPDS